MKRSWRYGNKDVDTIRDEHAQGANTLIRVSSDRIGMTKHPVEFLCQANAAATGFKEEMSNRVIEPASPLMELETDKNLLACLLAIRSSGAQAGTGAARTCAVSFTTQASVSRW